MMNRRNDLHTELYIDAVISGLAGTGCYAAALALCEQGIPIEIALRVLTRRSERRGPEERDRRRLPRIESRAPSDPILRRHISWCQPGLLQEALPGTACGQIFLNGRRQHKRIANEKP
jgi:hypothetical protein